MTISNSQLMVQEFHEAFGLAVGKANYDTKQLAVLRSNLIDEETTEVCEILDGWGREYDINNAEFLDLKALAKELADLLYVVYGTAVSFGIDAKEAFKRVHESNMSKLDEDGKPIYNSYGKVLKGPNYKEPDMTGVLLNDRVQP